MVQEAGISPLIYTQKGSLRHFTLRNAGRWALKNAVGQMCWAAPQRGLAGKNEGADRQGVGMLAFKEVVNPLGYKG